MRADPRKARTLGEACSNGDGTYNGFKLMAWLSECVSPGKGLSEEEAKRAWEDWRKKNEQGTGGRVA